MKRKRKKPDIGRKARKLPPMHGATGQRFGMSVTGYTVGDWCPTPDGSGPAEAVAIQIELADPQMPDMFIRLRTPAAVDEMIQALLRHKRSVWPEAS